MIANQTHAVQSFCARVINLCYDVQGANKLTDLTLLHSIAKGVEEEAKAIQDIYGGRLPRKAGGKK